MLVRREEIEDCRAVRLVNEQAFGRQDEADLVDRLRMEGAVLVSLVAEAQGRIAGHILFSRMWIETAREPVPAVALAPLAVIPDLQRQGIGGTLIEQGLDWLGRGAEKIVLVLGHPEYYTRFSFSTGKTLLLDSPFNPKAFMGLELRPGALENLHGRVRYPDAFRLQS